MTNNKLEQLEKALDKIRDPFLFPRPELNNTFENNTRNLLDVSYSLLYLAKEQQSEIKKLKEDLARNSISDEDQVVIWVDNKYYLIMKFLTSNVSFTLSKPCYNCVGCYSYGDTKFVLDGGAYPSLHLLEGHNVELIPVKDFNQKLETSYDFMGLDFYEK